LAERITSTVSLFADSQSIEIYACNVNCHILRNYENFAESRNCKQYFPNNIPFAKGNSRFVDCGAYTGDTLTELVNNVGLVDTYIGFEPDRDTFSKLAKTASGLRQKLGQAFLYPCAVGRVNESLTISGTVGMFALSETGGQSIQVVRLDDALAAFAPTMLKMDIEGAEIDTIHGASELIRAHHPDLAICVYHKISDYWEIPVMLHELNPNYEFYLRSHSSCTLETVLYATERSRSI
ncbi:MAG: FkbM family methyltransferase, partial [Synergistaceae bacterium]|nr:FkbM family methyltransferase [Synergistaceae bacterium]